MPKSTAVPAKKRSVSSSPWYDRRMAMDTRMTDALDRISGICKEEGAEKELQAVWNYIVDLQKRVPDWKPRDAEADALPMEMRNAIDEIRYRLEEEDDSVAVEAARDLVKFVESLAAETAALRMPLEFEYEAGRPLLIVKLGSDSKGWIPNAKHFAEVRRILKASGVDKKYNVMPFHYGISTEKVE